MKKKAIVLKIDEYDSNILKSKVKEALDKHFLLEDLLGGSNEVLLKPNLLIPTDPSSAITTHPCFIEAVGKIFKEKGFKVYIADNASAVSIQHSMRSVYKECGIEEVAKLNNFELLYPDKSYEIDNMPISWWAKDFKIINLPKLKTHSLSVLTCATKNLYGCISGAYKSIIHKLYPRSSDLMEILTKLYRNIKPAIHIVDAIVSLEGEGPAKKGSPKRTGFVVIGDDALCVDYVVSSIVNLPKSSNPIIKKAEALGLIDVDDIEIISELDNDKVIDFKLSSGSILNKIPPSLIKLLGFLFKLWPKIDKIKCTSCGDCMRVCPNRAIAKKKGKVAIDYSKCISCMCCNEVCRFGAVNVERTFFLKVLSKISDA